MTGIMWTEIELFLATLLYIAFLVKLARRWLPKSALVGVIALALITAMVPLNNLVIGAYIFSITSHLSISTGLLLIACIVLSCSGAHSKVLTELWQSSHQWLVLTIFFAITGLLLYPLASGLTLFDPYRLGYTGSASYAILPLYLMLWTMVSLWRAWHLLTALLVCSVIAFYLKILPSVNLWDYVMDPLVFIYSLTHLLKKLATGLLKLRHSNKRDY